MYDYKEQKQNIFKQYQADVKMFCIGRVKILELIKKSGCIQMSKAMSFFNCSNSFNMMAYVDFMVENGDLLEVNQKEKPMGQYRIFYYSKQFTQ